MFIRDRAELFCRFAQTALSQEEHSQAQSGRGGELRRRTRFDEPPVSVDRCNRIRICKIGVASFPPILALLFVERRIVEWLRRWRRYERWWPDQVAVGRDFHDHFVPESFSRGRFRRIAIARDKVGIRSEQPVPDSFAEVFGNTASPFARLLLDEESVLTQRGDAEDGEDADGKQNQQRLPEECRFSIGTRLDHRLSFGLSIVARLTRRGEAICHGFVKSN